MKAYKNTGLSNQQSKEDTFESLVLGTASADDSWFADALARLTVDGHSPLHSELEQNKDINGET